MDNSVMWLCAYARLELTWQLNHYLTIQGSNYHKYYIYLSTIIAKNYYNFIHIPIQIAIKYRYWK